MDFIISLPIVTDCKRDSYDSILVIVNWLMKMVYYEPVKVTTNALDFTEVIINVVVRHYNLPNSIVTDRRLLFTSKFLLLIYYFWDIKWKLSNTGFYHQTDKKIQRQNSRIEAYLQVFVNFKQNDWVWLLPMAKFAYNNAKNTSTCYTHFKLNCRNQICVFYEVDLNLCWNLRIAKNFLPSSKN